MPRGRNTTAGGGVACAESGVWLLAQPDPKQGLAIPAGPFRRALALRLGVSALPESDGGAVECPQCHVVCDEAYGAHAVGCMGGRTTRHHAIADALLKTLRRAGMFAQREKGIDEIASACGATEAATARTHALYAQAKPATAGNTGNVRPADLLIKRLAIAPASVDATVVVDVTVVRPDAQTALRRGQQPHAALNVAYEGKAKVARAVEVLGARLEPMVLSTNGRWHGRTAALVDGIARRAANAGGSSFALERTRLAQRVSVALHTGNGELLESAGARLRQTGETPCRAGHLLLPRQRAVVSPICHIHTQRW